MQEHTALHEALTCKVDKLVDPGFLDTLFPPSAGGGQNELTLQVLVLRRLAEGIRQGKRAYNVTLLNALLTAIIVICTAINLWFNWLFATSAGAGG